MEAYKEGASVLAYHGPLLYPAKIKQVAMSGDESIYFVHYDNWNKKHDEWMTSERILPITPANLKIKQQLADEQALKAPKRPLPKGASNGPEAKRQKKSHHKKDDASGSEEKKPHKHKSHKKQVKDEFSPSVSAKNRRKVDLTVLPTGQGQTDAESQLIPIPYPLKVLLVDDWEQITKQKRLVPLPRTPNIDSVLENFYKSSIARNPESAQLYRDVTDGLKSLIDQGLGSIALYRYERPQFDKIVASASGVALSKVYGAEHLLRLFTRIPGMLTHVTMDRAQVNCLVEKLKEFLAYLDDARDTAFLTNYDFDPAYAKMNKNLLGLATLFDHV